MRGPSARLDEYSQLQVIMIVERFICHVCGHVGTCARADAASAAAATRREKGAMAEGRTLEPNANRPARAVAGARPRKNTTCKGEPRAG